MFSTRLPVSVYGTGSLLLKRLEVFLGSPITAIIRAAVALRYYQPSAKLTDLPISPIPTAFNVLFRQYASVSPLRHPITHNKLVREY